MAFEWLQEKIDELWKKEVPKNETASIFNRLDVEQFFRTLSNLWYPSELIQKVGGYSKLELLYKDHDIYAAVDKRIAALLMSRMKIEGPDQSKVDFFEKQLRPHERQLKQDFWWTIFNGYGVEQIIYKEDASGDVSGFQREQFWRFEPQKDLIHVKLIDTTNQEYRNKIVPYGKWVLTTNNGTSYNPLGDAMAERLITPWIIKCTGWDLWIDFAKRFANGFMHGKISDMEKKDEFLRTLQKSGKSSIFVSDKDTELTVSSPSRDSSLYQALDDKTVRAIQKVILGETQTSDMAERGSSGSAGVQNEVRQEKTWADIDLVQKAMNEVVLQIGLVNGFAPETLPTVTLIWDPDFSIEQVTRDVGLFGIGVRFKKTYFEKNYPIDPEDFDLVDVDAIAAAQPSFGFNHKGKKTFLSPSDMKEFVGQATLSSHKCKVHNFDAASARKGAQGETEREDIVTVMSRNGAPPIDPKDLVSAILTSENRKDLEEKLNMLFDTRDNSFVDDLTSGLYYSAALGARMGNPEKLENEED